MDNKELIKHLSGVYERNKCSLKYISLDTIAELHDRITEAFHMLPCKILFVDEPLDDFEEVKKHFKMTDVIKISKLNNNSDLLPGNLNLWFRAWHDFIHLECDFSFTFEGEYHVFLKQSIGLSDKAKQILFSEIVLQASYALFYGTFAEIQKVVLIDYEKEMTDYEDKKEKVSG